jgi:VanZ family protein
MRALRLTALWQGLAWLLVGMAVWLSLGPPGAVEAVWVLPIPFSDKLGHFLAYAGLMVWFAGLYRREHHLLVAQYLFIFGLLMELTQGGLSHRSAEFGDMIANTAGILAGLLSAWAGLGHWCEWTERRLGLAHA